MQPFIILLMGFLLFSCATTKPDKKDNLSEAHARLSSPVIQTLEANVQMLETAAGIKVITRVAGLKPNSVHGFHIHETGKCEGPDFKSAGGHFNPTKHHHNGPEATERHVGDLGNLVANEKGVAVSEVVISHGDEIKMDEILGKAMIIHAKADDLVSQPAGNSGDRIACGLIEKGSIKDLF